MSYLLFMFLLSTGIVATKNVAADSKIERQGYKVNPDNRSIFESGISFIKDYFFLIVPIYNIIKAFKIFLSNDTEYANKRFEILQDRERISDVVVDHDEVVPSEVLSEEETIEDKNEETVSTNVEEYFTYDELIDYYKLKNRELRARHKKLVSLGKTKEANEVREVIVDITNRYNRLVNSQNNQIVLRRK